jgi:sigma-B regulation protein RsbU (phosphoserine phosphatase)
MPAALLMSNAQALLKSQAAATIDPHELCGRVNSAVCENIVPNRFISCFYALLDTQTQTLRYTNAGHYAPMLLRNGSCLRLTEGGPVLGVFPDQIFETETVPLHRCDWLVLFTDGVTEAQNENGEEFGEERLQGLLLANTDISAAELRERVIAAVTEFGSGSFYDDVTLLVLKIG